MNRRQLIKNSSFYGGIAGLSTLLPPSELLLADTADRPFVIYCHLGSICGMASGLVQPIEAGRWPKGFFHKGQETMANNPLLNQHHQHGALIFHDYLKFLGDIAEDMCLVNGSPRSLDHNVARPFQRQGQISGPEWAMGLAQAQALAKQTTSTVITQGRKTSVTDAIRTIAAKNKEELVRLSKDYETVPQEGVETIWQVLKKRYSTHKPSFLANNPHIGDSLIDQIGILTKGIGLDSEDDPGLSQLQVELSEEKVRQRLSSIQDRASVSFDVRLAESLILAGFLAKSGLAQGLTIDGIRGHDFHNGGADVMSARAAAMFWAQISNFWQWVKSQGLDQKILVIVSHEFGRSPYNKRGQPNYEVDTTKGKVQVNAPGRDHGPFFGSMFLNSQVPKMGRIGNVVNNLTPLPGIDQLGSITTGESAYHAPDMVGSMLMRVYPKLFPDARSVRRFWPAFQRITPLL